MCLICRCFLYRDEEPVLAVDAPRAGVAAHNEPVAALDVPRAR